MKKSAFLLVLLISSSSVMLAQDHSRRDRDKAPVKVEESFRRDHPDAKDVEWKRSNRQWHSRHMDQDKQVHIDTYYDERGRRVDMHRELHRNDVPREIDEHIRQRYHVSDDYEAIRIERPNQPVLFQLKIKLNGIFRFIYTDEHGKEVRYNDRH